MAVQEIRMAPDVKQKYVLVRVIHEGAETLVLWGNRDVQWHKDILEEITNTGYKVTEVLGGGWLLPDLENKVIYVWGKSDRLGAAPVKLVKEVLKTKVIEEEPL